MARLHASVRQVPIARKDRCMVRVSVKSARCRVLFKMSPAQWLKELVTERGDS
jgi:hypothetical protein